LNQIQLYDDSKIKLTRNIKYIKKLVKREKVQKLLDVGSSDGKLLLALQNFNMVAMGVEPNTSAATNCRKLGLQVKDGFFTKEKFAGQKFQLINFADVIEHVADPKLMLQDALSILELNGLIVIRTPNLDSLWSKLTLIISKISSVPWSSLTPPKHLSNFSHENLKDFLRLDQLRLENTFFEPPTLFYELGQLHLLRDFRQKKSFINLGRLFLGYAWYTFIFILLKVVSPITHKNFSQTITVRKVI
jgi:SAM-dependent methyltransferase